MWEAVPVGEVGGGLVMLPTPAVSLVATPADLVGGKLLHLAAGRLGHPELDVAARLDRHQPIGS